MRKIHLIIALAALVLFAWVIAHVGLSTMVAQLKAMRIALPIVMALSVLRLFLQSTTWSASLKGENVAVNTTTLIGVRLASQSMGYLTVLGPVISEPMKIKLLGTSERTNHYGNMSGYRSLLVHLGFGCNFRYRLSSFNRRSWRNLPLDTSYSCACFCCVRHYTSQTHPCWRCARVWQARSFLARARRTM